MMEEELSRRELKACVRELLKTAQVPAKNMTALYMGLLSVLSLLSYFGGAGLPSLFLSVLTWLLSLALDAGYVLYCMGICRRARVEYTNLFDGVSLIVKLFVLELTQALFIFLWSLLFLIPGIVAAYRYRFALFNLLENPELDVMEALGMSKRQTEGYKGQLFLLDLSYLGWLFLAGLPETIYRSVMQMRTADALSALTGSFTVEDVLRVMEGVSGTVMGLSASAWQFIILGAALIAALFYLPNYRCVELAYFAAAKQDSGVGEPIAESGGDFDFE